MRRMVHVCKGSQRLGQLSDDSSVQLGGFRSFDLLLTSFNPTLPSWKLVFRIHTLGLGSLRAGF